MISLGIDIGGTGCKCVAFDESATELAQAYREYPVPAGTVNLPAEIMRDSVLYVIKACIEKLEDPKQVRAITVASFGESFVPVDREGKPLTDIMMYFGNSECAAFDRLVNEFGAENIMEIARVMPDPSYSLAKMLYTMQIAPRPVWKFLFIASYITFCLCGETVTDEPLACRSLIFNVARRTWSRSLMAAAGIREDQLPTVIHTGDIAGTILPDVADRIGLSHDVKIVMGTHDQIVNALGSGIYAPGQAVDVTGTVECIEPLFTEMPGLDFVRNNYACVPYVDDLGYVTYAYNISGGMTVRWYRDAIARHLSGEAARLNCSVYDLMNAECPKEPTGLIALPYLQGMGGTPDVNTSAKGLIAGLTTNTTSGDIYRALLEGLCFEMQYNLEKLTQSIPMPNELHACGGGARSPIWLQIKADVWNATIVPVAAKEAGALGSAILGFAAVNGEKSRCKVAKRFLRHAEPVLPDPARHAYYMEQYEKFKKLRSLADLV